MDAWLEEHLVCPRDHGALRQDGAAVVCSAGHHYPCVDGIPVMLLDDVRPTHVAFHERRTQAALDGTPEEAGSPSGGGIDPYVQEMVAGTCGYMYRGLIRRLTAYPIPDLPLPLGHGEPLLDIGCGWGRWSLSAARRGYTAVGLDPSLDAIRAARRVAAQLDVPAHYVVADARHLPFRAGTFGVAFSYSVLQHFDKPDAKRALTEIARVLGPGGRALIEMPNAFGLRNLYHQCRRGFREPEAFEVRYWSPDELRRTFAGLIGPTSILVDGYFSLNPQVRDLMLLPFRFRFVLYCSAFLRSMSVRLPWLVYAADSLYVRSVRRADT